MDAVIGGIKSDLAPNGRAVIFLRVICAKSSMDANAAQKHVFPENCATLEIMARTSVNRLQNIEPAEMICVGRTN